MQQTIIRMDPDSTVKDEVRIIQALRRTGYDYTDGGSQIYPILEVVQKGVPATLPPALRSEVKNLNWGGSLEDVSVEPPAKVRRLCIKSQRRRGSVQR